MTTAISPFKNQHRKYLRGLFIETSETLSVGQTIELKMPDRQTYKIKLLIGEIVRSDPRGAGSRVKRMSDTNGGNAI